MWRPSCSHHAKSSVDTLVSEETQTSRRSCLSSVCPIWSAGNAENTAPEIDGRNWTGILVQNENRHFPAIYYAYSTLLVTECVLSISSLFDWPTSQWFKDGRSKILWMEGMTGCEVEPQRCSGEKPMVEVRGANFAEIWIFHAWRWIFPATSRMNVHNVRKSRFATFTDADGGCIPSSQSSSPVSAHVTSNKDISNCSIASKKTFISFSSNTFGGILLFFVCMRWLCGSLIPLNWLHMCNISVACIPLLTFSWWFINTM